ncbi:DNA cytosine methyltransferase [Paenibacillus larvae]
MRKLSLFSGIGGIDLAAKWAGIETVAFCEKELFPRKVLKKHWPKTPIYDDVCTLTREVLEQDGIIGTGRTIDLISAGYPCQPFSNAGRRKGKEDDRHLWPEVARLLQEIRPSWFIGENVAGHITLGLDDVLSDLESIGYDTQAIVIPACAVGAPHRRDRVFVLGYTECVRCSGKSRRRAREVSSHRYSKLEKRPMAYTKSKFAGGLPGRTKTKNSRPTCSCSNDQRWTEGTTKSRLGGVLDGISDWLDRYKWPVGLGQEQYDWEPARIETGVQNRVGRIKALGNAVNPVQVYPFLEAIKAINDQIQGE